LVNTVPNRFVTFGVESGCHQIVTFGGDGLLKIL